MLILYTKQRCPFCVKVQEAAQELGIEFDERDIEINEEYANELLEEGGKRQVPYLYDDERDVGMYESDDIIAYLKEHYSPSDAGEAADDVSEDGTEDDQEKWS